MAEALPTQSDMDRSSYDGDPTFGRGLRFIVNQPSS